MLLLGSQTWEPTLEDFTSSSGSSTLREEFFWMLTPVVCSDQAHPVATRQMMSSGEIHMTWPRTGRNRFWPGEFVANVAIKMRPQIEYGPADSAMIEASEV
jgi:hypothetical protein